MSAVTARRPAAEARPASGCTVVLAEALKDRELESPKWCAECATSERVPSSGDGCASHAIGLEFVDAFRRVAYRRLPGRPKIEVDL